MKTLFRAICTFLLFHVFNIIKVIGADLLGKTILSDM